MLWHYLTLSFSVPYISDISGCWILLRLESHRGIRYCARPVASANCSTSRGAFPLPCHLHRRPCPTGSYTAPGISRAGYGSLQGGDNPAWASSKMCLELQIYHISDKTGISKLMHNLLVSFVEMATPFLPISPHFPDLSGLLLPFLGCQDQWREIIQIACIYLRSMCDQEVCNLHVSSSCSHVQWCFLARRDRRP